MRSERVIFRVHALQRMFEREISLADIINTIEHGEIIEEYPKDEPYPSHLMLGWSGERPIHIVVGAGEQETAIVITVYQPDADKWDTSFKHRRAK
ncbi:MAG: DUF4258 domain-containing protein [Anaerolineales bacterium]